MKKLKITDKTQCKACLACVRACSEAFYKEFDQDLACIRITAKEDGTPVPNVCIQCGKCAKACTHDAISQNAKGVYVIDQKKCQHCGDCVKACPFHVMAQVMEPAKVSKCIACGICAKACPMEILEVVEA
ncbi:MAG: 4Fe-4S binding protein [Bacillota bacterium]|nr:4Fe-4S binding protein [Bacillota bacterium]